MQQKTTMGEQLVELAQLLTRFSSIVSTEAQTNAWERYKLEVLERQVKFLHVFCGLSMAAVFVMGVILLKVGV